MDVENKEVQVQILKECVWNVHKKLWQHLVIIRYPRYQENVSMSHEEIKSRFPDINFKCQFRR